MKRTKGWVLGLKNIVLYGYFGFGDVKGFEGHSVHMKFSGNDYFSQHYVSRSFWACSNETFIEGSPDGPHGNVFSDFKSVNFDFFYKAEIKFRTVLYRKMRNFNYQDCE